MASLRTAATLLLLSAAPCAFAAEVVARIGGTSLTTDELRAYLETLPEAERAALEKDPALLSQVVRTHLARLAVLGEAQAKKWDQKPAVKAQLDRVRAEALTELYLQEVSQPPDGFPGDAEVQASYDANRAAFALPRRFRVAQIFVAAGAEGEQDERRKRMEKIARKVAQKGTDFAAVARAESEEKDTAARGGEIGWLTEAQMVPGIRTVVAGLGKDATSEPIRLEDGWHVVKVLEVKPPATRPLAEVRAAIVAQLRAERARSARQAYLARLLEQSPPVVNELVLSAMLRRPR